MNDAPSSAYSRRPKRFQSIPKDQWSNWHWQHQHRLSTPGDFEGVLTLSDAELEGFRRGADRFHVAITPHYASLISASDPSCPIRRQAIPNADEIREYDFEYDDPLAEEDHMPVPGLTHRYPDRALLYVTHHCPVYCRHCTRKRKVSNPHSAASTHQLAQGLQYIANTPQIRDVIISGGDPLTLSDERLDDLLTKLRQIPHLDVIRLGTRNPVTLPQRINDDFCAMLHRHGPLYINTHFNHPRELCAESVQALRRLVRAGCVLGNQMVLLREINDDPQTVMTLNRGLLRTGCRPYYILQCDMARGITHFRTPLSTGLAIMDHLRGRIGGLGVPDFVIDLPGGGGKVELLPDYIVDRQPTEYGDLVRFRNFDGEEYEFVDISAGRDH